MKKFACGLAVAALLATASCSKDSATDTADSRFAVSQETSDSISTLYGTMVGGFILSDYQHFSEETKTPDMKEDLIKGIRLAVGEGQSEGVMMGLQVGMRMAQELKQLEEQGVKVDREAVIKNFIKAFSADSADMTALQENNRVYGQLLEQVRALDMQRRDAEKAESPQAKQNEGAGKAYIQKVKTADPAVKESSTGLVYKVENRGEGNIADNSAVTLYYTGKLVDGTVFDSTKPGSPATFSPSQVIPGFSEGLKLLGKGGKATFYIPSNLAYGLNAPEQIGPNQTLVFEVEVVDVKTPEAPAAK